MPVIGSFSSWIQVDGKPLTEYQVEYSPDGTQATCWIPSEVGKEFQICCRDSVRALTTATKVTVDGTRCGGKILHAKHSNLRRPGRKGKSTVTHQGAVITDSTIRPYIFSSCQLLDDDSLNFLSHFPGIGEIKLDIQEIQAHSRTSRRRPVTLPPLQIHERAKKGIVHGTQLGEEVSRRQKQQPRKTTFLRELVSFVFKYRPLAVLIADGIAPSSNLQPRKLVSGSEDVIDLTLDDEEPRRPRGKSRSRVKTEIKTERSIIFDNTIIDLTV